MCSRADGYVKYALIRWTESLSPLVDNRGRSRTCTSAAWWQWWPPVQNCPGRGWWRGAGDHSTAGSDSRSPPRRRTHSGPGCCGLHTCCCFRSRRGLQRWEVWRKRLQAQETFILSTLSVFLLQKVLWLWNQMQSFATTKKGVYHVQLYKSYTSYIWQHCPKEFCHNRCIIWRVLRGFVFIYLVGKRNKGNHESYISQHVCTLYLQQAPLSVWWVTDPP